MTEYIAFFKNREIARGDFLTVVAEVNGRGGFETITPSQRGYRFNRVLLDLMPDFEIKPKATP